VSGVVLESAEPSVMLSAEAARRAASRPSWSAFLVVFVPFAAIAVVLSLAQRLPVLVLDEGLYQHLARSLAGGEGFDWRGQPVSMHAALYVYLIAPAWIVASGWDAYQLAKAETALLMCATAVPIWLLARSLVPRPLAQLAVALTLSGTWMLGAGNLMTEAVALPLGTACLAATVQAVRTPGRRWTAVAFALAVLATWGRLQLAVLIPIMFSALALDVARQGRAWRARARVHGIGLAALGLLSVAGVLASLVTHGEVTGSYDGVADYRWQVGVTLDRVARALLDVPALCVFLPAGLLIAAAGRRRAWRDPVVGPLLTVLLPAVLLFGFQTGWFIAGSGVPWDITRYLIYVVPLLLLFAVAATAATGVFSWRALAGAASLIPLLLLVAPVAQREEQRATFTTVDAVDRILPGISDGQALAFAAAAAAIVAALIAWRVPPPWRALAIGILMLVGLVGQTATAWHWRLQVTDFVRSTTLPRDLLWVEHHTRDEPVAVLTVTGSTREFWLSDFFNRNLIQYYSTTVPVPGPNRVQGAACAWSIAPDGTARFPAACPLKTDVLWLGDPLVRLHFAGERVLGEDRRLGRLVRVPARPRIETFVQMPCERNPLRGMPITGLPAPAEAALVCDPRMAIRLRLRAAAKLVLTVRGAPTDPHAVAVGGRQYAIAPATDTRIVLPVPDGHADFVVDLDWAEQGTVSPDVVGVDLVTGGRARSLL
jgi:hypothetical protein